MTTIAPTSVLSSLPSDPLQGQPPSGIEIAKTYAPARLPAAEQQSGDGAAGVFAGYIAATETTAAPPSSQPSVLGLLQQAALPSGLQALPRNAHASTEVPAAPETRGQPAGIDAMAVVRRIAREWETAGVDPAWIQTIRNPVTWQLSRVDGAPALVKLGEDLQRTGEFSTLRKQAIQLLRGTRSWQLMVDRRVAENPGIPRWRHDHQLVQSLFSWKDDAPRENALVVDRIVNAQAIADKDGYRPA